MLGREVRGWLFEQLSEPPAMGLVGLV